MGWRTSASPTQAAQDSTMKGGNANEVKPFGFESMNRFVQAFTGGPNVAREGGNEIRPRGTSRSSSLADEHIEPTPRRGKSSKAMARTKYIASAVLAVGILALGGVSYLLYDMLVLPEYNCPSAGEPPVELGKGKRVALRPSSRGEVCVIQGDTVLGRSYDGLQWEESAGASTPFACESNGICSVSIPSESTFLLTTYSSTLNSNTDKDISRFLLQASFGPTKSEISSWGSKTFKEWIVDQQKLPASLHRSYFRKRVSQRTAISSGPGRPREACENLSRWHRHTFTKNDVGSTFAVSAAGASRITLRKNGQARVEIDHDDWALSGGNFKICNVEERVGGTVKYGAGDCSKTSPNPALNFGSSPARLIPFTSDKGTMRALAAPVNEVLILSLRSGSRLASCTFQGRAPVYVVNPANGLYYQHDRRLVLSENTVESPAEGTTAEGPYCVSAPKTFLNLESCVVGGRSCAPVRYSSKNVLLNDATIRNFYTKGGHFVYRMQGLRPNMYNPPCNGNRRSRWIKLQDCSGGNDNGRINGATLTTFQNAFSASLDPNPTLRDLQIGKDDACNLAKGSTLLIDGQCWKNVHPQHFNVYDLTWWSEVHKVPNQIILPAEANSRTFLTFPGGHDSDRWEYNYKKFGLLGRFMDNVDFAKLPSTVQSPAMAALFGVSTKTSPEDDFSERCGSPGEVANDPGLGARYAMGLTSTDDLENTDITTLDARFDSGNFKTSAWTMNAVFAEDQLRQRMAFALSQILVITAQQLEKFETESYLAYYDIFVRHAFGNFRDILREVSFSPMMADMLSFLETKSFEFSLRYYNKDVFPDENYAREIMQLFSIGLNQLNNDGSSKTDGNGTILETYTNEDIMAFARSWTGFHRQNTRGNIESVKDVDSPNLIDPMRIVGEHRDKFPKMNLYKGHIGDGYPLCVDLPEKMFLRKGAKWIYLGKNPMPTKVEDPEHLRFAAGVKRVVLNPGSDLYKTLCNQRGSECEYKSYVQLPEQLACTGIECKVDTMRVVKVGQAYYEFIRPACIRFPFFNSGIKIQRAHWRDAMCAHPKEIVAAEACCNQQNSNDARQDCLYHGEKLSFATAQARCAETGKRLCNFVYTAGSCLASNGRFYGLHWTDTGCKTLVKIGNDGKVAVVHDPLPGPSNTNTKRDMEKSVRNDNRNWFRVAWKDDRFPSSENSCGQGCKVIATNNCLCAVTVTESAVFSGMPSKMELVNRLHIGSLSPELFDSGEYTLLPASTDELKVYVRQGGSAFDKSTVFSTVVKGEWVHRVNMESKVVLPNGESFRNPANMMGIVKPTTRDAEYETEAVIDHFFKHPNCPPFIAYRIIQRFVTSNPSPRYVDVCAKAFSEGSYEGIGSGKYGDLGALIAAVLLDREARETLLDADPVHGQMREPLLKIIHVLRSLEVEPRGNREIELDDIQAMVGEMAHMAPDVFSFFKPEYSPAGPLATAQLAGPEAQVFTGPKVIALFNGLISLVRLGLTDCYGGFGNHFEGHTCWRMNNGDHDAFRISPAKLSWSPDNTNEASIVDELSLLLTAGRLDNSSRTKIIAEVKDEKSKKGLRNAIIVAQQLLLATPEFHVSTVVQRTVVRGQGDDSGRNGTSSYKAIIYIMLYGGLDSFNVLIPHSRCKGGKDKYAEYKAVRTDIALAKEGLLPIDSEPGTQVCDVFGLHPSIPRIQQQYERGHALFMANVGPLVEPVNKRDVNKGRKRLPASLFAHNTQQKSTQTNFPQTNINTGVIGRMNDALHEQGFSTSAFSISGKNFVQEGTAGPPQNFMDSGGVRGLDPAKSSKKFTRGLTELNSNYTKNFYAETWGATVAKALVNTEILQNVLDSAELEQDWTARSDFGRQLEQVAKIIKARGELGAERQTFFTSLDGLDTHNNKGSHMVYRLEAINEAVYSFEAEMRAQGVWDDVVIISASEFGRTLTSNGAGTDHGWGGNYFMLGGGVMGGRIIGEYPEDLSSKGKENVGRGRLLPTTSWDSIWNAVAMWFGVDIEKITEVIPNRDNFKDQLLTQNDLFGTKNQEEPTLRPGEKLGIGLGASIAIAAAGVALIAAVAKYRNRAGSKESGNVPAKAAKAQKSRQKPPRTTNPPMSKKSGNVPVRAAKAQKSRQKKPTKTNPPSSSLWKKSGNEPVTAAKTPSLWKSPPSSWKKSGNEPVIAAKAPIPWKKSGNAPEKATKAPAWKKSGNEPIKAGKAPSPWKKSGNAPEKATKAPAWKKSGNEPIKAGKAPSPWKKSGNAPVKATKAPAWKKSGNESTRAGKAQKSRQKDQNTSTAFAQARAMFEPKQTGRSVQPSWIQKRI